MGNLAKRHFRVKRDYQIGRTKSRASCYDLGFRHKGEGGRCRYGSYSFWKLVRGKEGQKRREPLCFREYLSV